MIRVNINYYHSKIESLNVVGHANFKSDNEEFDTICAAVSSIVFGALNMLDKNNFEGDLLVEDNLIIIKLNQNDFNKIIFQNVLETVYTQLDTIQQSYGKYIKINLNTKEKNNHV